MDHTEEFAKSVFEKIEKWLPEATVKVEKLKADNAAAMAETEAMSARLAIIQKTMDMLQAKLDMVPARLKNVTLPKSWTGSYIKEAEGH